MTTGEKIIQKAESYKGKTGGFVWDYWKGLAWGASWCVGFVLYVLYKCGLKSEIYNPSKTSLPFWLPTIEEWLHKHATHVKMADARPGDIVIFTWTGGGNNSRKVGKCSRDHIGFIRKKGTSKICYTIEGNTSGGKVAERTRELTYIFAIYRLDCCKDKAEEKPAGQEQETKEKKHPALYVPKAGEKCYDLSDHQGKLSKAYFEGIKKKGVTCVILRSSYTRVAKFELHVDAHFVNNIKNAIAAGMHIGIYHYSSAITAAESAKEAAFCMKTIAPYMEHIDLPVALDCEFGPKNLGPRFTAAVAKRLGKTGMGKIVDGFCVAVKAAGYETMLYANLTMFNRYLPADIHTKYKIWIAQYNKTCDYKHKYYMWQFTSNNGKLDENVFGDQGTVAGSSEGTSLPARGYFKKGDKGPEVEAFQRLLNKKNKGSILPDLDPDGDFGDKTEEHVTLFQDARHLTVDKQVGTKTLSKLNTCKITPAWMAINFAVSVARSSKYTYGVGQRAHRGGCPFCGTNTGPVKKKKEQKGEPHFVNSKGKKWKEGDGKKYTYENTYCCNPFVFSAYAHGAGDKKMLKKCKEGGNATTGMDPKEWAKWGFEIIGKTSKVAFEDLEPGDVIMISSHVLMYTGSGWLVEASGGNFSASSIAHKKVAKSRYAKYRKNSTGYVVRYKG